MPRTTNAAGRIRDESLMNLGDRVADTLKTKVGDVVGCIFDVECTVGGFLILKQIYSTVD
jgi:hypothetical protein